MASSSRSQKKQRVADDQVPAAGEDQGADDQVPAAGGHARSSRPEADSKKKYSTQGFGSKARRREQRSNQEAKNIQRTEHNLPIPTCSLSQQIKWEQRLAQANTMRAQSTAQVEEEASRWKFASVGAVPGSVVLPSYIPPTAPFVMPQGLQPPCTGQAPPAAAQRPTVPVLVPDCPEPGEQYSGPRFCPQVQVQESPPPGQYASNVGSARVPHVPLEVSNFRGAFQGAQMHGPGAQVGYASPLAPTGTLLLKVHRSTLDLE